MLKIWDIYASFRYNETHTFKFKLTKKVRKTKKRFTKPESIKSNVIIAEITDFFHIPLYILDEFFWLYCYATFSVDIFIFNNNIMHAVIIEKFMVQPKWWNGHSQILWIYSFAFCWFYYCKFVLPIIHILLYTYMQNVEKLYNTFSGTYLFSRSVSIK